MRPLSDATPKPLLEVHGKPLIEWHLEALAARRRARGRHQHRLARGADRRRARRRLALRPRDRATRWKAATTAARSRPPAASPRRCRCSATRSGSSLPMSTRPTSATGRGAARPSSPGGRLGRLWLVPNPHFHPRGDFGLGADGLGLADGAGPDGAALDLRQHRPAARDDVRRHRPRHAAPRWRRCSTPACGRGRSAPRSIAAAGRTSARPEQLAALNASPEPPRRRSPAVSRPQRSGHASSIRCITSGVSFGEHVDRAEVDAQLLQARRAGDHAC
mgnify:CR=1 FL=1